MAALERAVVEHNELLALRRELDIASDIQRSFLPRTFPDPAAGGGFALHAAMVPAKEVGGDFYDFFSLDGDRLAVVIGDVSGKGVPAALYGAFAGELVRSRTIRRRYSRDHAGPAAMLASINSVLYERQLEEYYCTLLYSVFDFKHRTVTLANAALPYPVRKRADGLPATQIELPGVPLGSFPGSTYDEIVLDLRPGDVFVFCSDGVTEAQDAHFNEFGADRLLAIVDRLYDQPAQAIVDAIFEEVHAFRGECPPNDDTTAVVVRVAAI